MQITTMLFEFNSDAMKYIVFNGFPGEQSLDVNTFGEKIVKEYFTIDMQANELELAENWFQSRQMEAMLQVSHKVKNSGKNLK